MSVIIIFLTPGKIDFNSVRRCLRYMHKLREDFFYLFFSFRRIWPVFSFFFLFFARSGAEKNINLRSPALNFLVTNNISTHWWFCLLSLMHLGMTRCILFYVFTFVRKQRWCYNFQPLIWVIKRKSLLCILVPLTCRPVCIRNCAFIRQYS